MLTTRKPPELPEPRPYQIESIKFMVQRPAAGLLLDPGLGKTRCALTAIKLLRARGMISRTLVIAPLRVAESVWRQEAEKWQTGLRVNLVHGGDKERQLRSEAEVYVINPEGLDWLTRQRMELPKLDCLIIDESSKFKATDTLRFKLIKSILGQFKRRYIMTGSPTPNGLMNLFSQIYILDLGEALGRSIRHYRAMYFSPDFTGFGWRLNVGAEEKIYDKIRPLVIRKDALDHLDMPGLPQLPPVWVDLPAKAQKLYKDLEDELVVQLESGDHIVATNAAVLTGKLRQVANGAVYLRDANWDPNTSSKLVADRKWKVLHDAKLNALEDLLEELDGHNVIVVYEFQHDLARLLKRWPKAPYLGGGVTGQEFEGIIKRWNAGRIPILLAHPQSVSHGLNLQEGPGHTIVWFGLTWSLEDYDQMIRRLWRQGQKSERVLVYHILARDTVDETMMGVLEKKARSQDALLQALKQDLKKRGAKREEDGSRTGKGTGRSDARAAQARDRQPRRAGGLR